MGWPFTGGDRTYRLAVAVGTVLWRALGVRRSVRGDEVLPDGGPAILAITHFGYLDFGLVQDAVWRRRGRYTRFLVTEAAFAHGIAGPLLRAMRHIPVHRPMGAGAYRTAGRLIRRGELVGIFPESAVSVSSELLPFKPGAAALALETGAPLIPVVVWGGHQVVTKGVGLTPRAVWRRARHARVDVRFGEPVRLDPADDPAAATDRLRTALTGLVAAAARDAPDRAPELLPRRG